MRNSNHRIVETLEARRLFNGAYQDANGLIHATGTPRGDTIFVRISISYAGVSQSPKTVDVKINDNPYVSFPFSSASGVEVHGGAGRDKIICEGSGFLFPDSHAKAMPLRFVGGRGDDTMYGAGKGNIVLVGNGGNDFLTVLPQTTGNATMYGCAGNDQLTSATAAATGGYLLSGGPGDDVLEGGHGDDTLLGGEGDDGIYGGDGDNLIFAGAGHDSVNELNWEDGGAGHTGNDAIFGGGGDDWLNGKSGSDLLVGGAGTDSLDS